MKCNIMINNADPRIVDKSNYISIIATIDAMIPDISMDILRPILIINYDDKFLQANYCWIDELNRYYYINSMQLDSAKRLQLSCSVDALFTYNDQIRQCIATVIRSESVGSNNIVDTKMPIDPQKCWIDGKLFPYNPLGNIIDPTSDIDIIQDYNTAHNYIIGINNGGKSN